MIITYINEQKESKIDIAKINSLMHELIDAHFWAYDMPKRFALTEDRVRFKLAKGAFFKFYRSLDEKDQQIVLNYVYDGKTIQTWFDDELFIDIF